MSNAHFQTSAPEMFDRIVIRNLRVSIFVSMIILGIICIMAIIAHGSYGLPDHDPIRIVGDAGFNSTNGVTSGTGTPSDPYIIENLNLNATDSDGIYIEDTSRHFIIRNISINNVSTISNKVGVNLVRVTSGSIENVSINYSISSFTIRTYLCRNVTMENITSPPSHMVRITQSQNMTFAFIESGSFELDHSSLCKVMNCTVISTAQEGLWLYYSHNNTVSGCNVTSDGYGIYLYGYTNDNLVTDCSSWGNSYSDVSFRSTGKGNVFRNNSFEEKGIRLTSNTVVDLGADFGTTNTVAGKPLLVLEDASGVLEDKILGQLLMFRPRDLLVSNVTVIAGHDSIYIAEGDNITLRNSKITSYYPFLHTYLCSNLTLSNFDTGITFFYLTSWLSVIDSNFEGVGLYIYGNQGMADTILISNTTPNNGSYGIWIRECGTSTIKIENCPTINIGITIEASAGVTIKNCSFEFNGPSWPSRTVDIESSGTVVVSNCAFSYGSNSIYANSFTEASIFGNTFQWVLGSAITANLANTLIHNNTIEGHRPWEPLIATEVGIALHGDNNTCLDNILRGVTKGIYVSYDVHGTRIERCTIDGRRGHSSTGITFYSWAPTISDVTILDCSINNTTNGIWISFTHRILIEDCVMTNSLYGVRLEDIDEGEISRSVFVDLGHRGISIDHQSDDVTVHHNNFVRCNYDYDTKTYDGPQASDRSVIDWDDGSEGNYWADYVNRYPNAQRNGRIWDTPYVVDGGKGASDRYPFAMFLDYEPPVADAGPNQTVSQNEDVYFNGSGSTDNLGIVGFRWNFTYDGSPRSLVGIQTSFMFAYVGVYNVTLFVRDAWGHWANDTITVTVLDSTPPTANAGSNLTVGAGEEFELTANGSTDNVGIVSLEWRIRGEGFLDELEGWTVTYSIADLGTYTAELVLYDAAGNEASAIITIEVLDIIPPVAVAGPDRTVDQGTTVEFNGSGSYDNIGIDRFTWAFTYDGGVVRLNGMVVSHEYVVPGRYDVTLSVHDVYDLVGTDVMILTVVDTEPPVAWKPNNMIVDQGEIVTFTDGGSTDNKAITSYTWTFDYDGSEVTLVGHTATFNFDEVGEYGVTLRVEDAEGNANEATFTVTVKDTERPVADAGDDITVDLGEVVTFDGSGSRDNVKVVSYAWTLEEGGSLVTMEGSIVSHIFDVPGTYVVTLTVLDLEGLTATDDIIVTVMDTEAPFAEAGPDIHPIIGTTYRLDGTGSTDNVGIVRYLWTIPHPDGDIVLEGPIQNYTFNLMRLFFIRLDVYDAAGNWNADDFSISVFPELAPVRLGPFLDEHGNTLFHVELTVTLNGTVHTRRTNDDGNGTIDVEWTDLPGTATVHAHLDGYEDVEFTVELDDWGIPSGEIPVMQSIESSSMLWVVAGILIAVIAVLSFALLIRSRQKRA